MSLAASFLCAAAAAFLFPPEEEGADFPTNLKAFFGRRTARDWAWRLPVAGVAFVPIYLFFGRLVVPLPDCLAITSRRWQAGAGCERSPTGGMLVDQVVHRAKRVAMQTTQELARRFGLSQATTAGLIFGQGNLTELVQQILLTFRQAQDLALSEVPQLPGGFASTDAALVAAKLAKQGLQLQVVGRQAGDVIAVQPIRTTRFPQPVPGPIESGLRRATFAVRLKGSEQFFHLSFDLLTRQRGRSSTRGGR